MDRVAAEIDARRVPRLAEEQEVPTLNHSPSRISIWLLSCFTPMVDSHSRDLLKNSGHLRPPLRQQTTSAGSVPLGAQRQGYGGEKDLLRKRKRLLPRVC